MRLRVPACPRKARLERRQQSSAAREKRLALHLGLIFDMFGWTACVAGIAVALIVAALLAIFLRTPMAPEAMAH